jgi:SAM-dependent methyltransferase
MAMTTHWEERAKNWESSGPPKRPTQSVIDQIKGLVGDDGLTLILGVTPQLAEAFTSVHAVDREPEMVSRVWPGDTETKRAECIDWNDIQGYSVYDSVVGDGSLNMVSFPDGAESLLSRILELLKPGGRLACRVFTRPEDTPTLRRLKDLADGSSSIGFDAWRTVQSHHLTTYVGENVPVNLMVEFFDVHWPDRESLAATNGWDIEKLNIVMESYRSSSAHTSFPTAAEWLSIVPPNACDVQLIPTDGYELAESFPILTFTKAL